MRRKVGLWVDHKKATIVSILEKGEEISHIESDFEGHFRLSGGSRSPTPYGPQETSSETKQKERRKHQLHRYYQDIIRAVQDAKRIWIFGPGEAKIELEKEIRRSKELSEKLVGVEAADKMTQNQIAAKVRKFFAPRTGR